MKTITTSKSSLLTILGLASVLILVALAFVGLFLAQRMQAVNAPPAGVRPGETQRKNRAPCLTLPPAHITQRLVRFPSRAISKANSTPLSAPLRSSPIPRITTRAAALERF